MDKTEFDKQFVLQPVIEELDSSYLYGLLKERDIELTSISHRKMPTWEDHLKFLRTWRDRYRSWFIIASRRGVRAGTVYLTKQDEIGIQVERSWQGCGIGKWAICALMERFPEVKRFYANINPRNVKSIHLFRSLDFFDCQLTLQWVREEHIDGPVIPGTQAGLHEEAGGGEHPSAIGSGES